jgi:hypothetical protein
MGYLGRRIGKSQDQGDSNPTGADGAVGGGILDLFANGYFERQGNIYNAPGSEPSGMTATGGVISDYSEGPTVYRAHIFTSSGTFDVTASGDFGDTVEYLVVAGGGAGGGGAFNGGGGGAGGYRTGTGVPVSVGSYPITVGAGGAGANTDTTGNQGGPSVFNAPGSEGTTKFTSTGGGGGGAHDASPRGGAPGGSGGGGSQAQGPPGNGNTPPTSPAQGYPGSGNWYAAAGGGGGAGGPHPGAPGPSGGGPFPNDGGTQDKISGGIGVRTPFGGPLYAIGVPGPGGTGGYLAGGGGGGGRSAYSVPQGLGKSGGGDGGAAPDPGDPGSDGTAGTGGGGGGIGGNLSNGSLQGGNGGSGIVVVRYQISSVAAQKATGGNISFYGGKTIHTFTNSGTFTAPGTFNETITYVAVGGGGGGGVQHGGGGGAGGYITADIPLNAGGSDVPVAIVIGAGGAGMAAKGSLLGTAGGPENNGNNTTIGFPSPVTAGYGGGGAQLGPPSGSPLGVGGSAPLGSGGGGGMKQPGVSGDNKGTGGPQGNNGGSSIVFSGGGVGGGGGGAGAAGGDPSSPNPEKGAGGIGVQVHPYFRDPVAAPSATTPTEPRFAGQRGGGLGTPGPGGQFYLAGGGGGAAHVNWPYSVDGKYGADGGFGGGGYGGNNTPGSEPQYHAGADAVVNTGGGGGASGPHTIPGGSGGSGIVLIAYPT